MRKKEYLLMAEFRETNDLLSVTLSTIAHWQQRLEEAQKDGTWHQELRPLRRALSSLRNKLHCFGLEISTVRERGCSLTSLMRPYP